MNGPNEKQILGAAADASAGGTAMAPQRFRKKPVVIMAVEWTGDNWPVVIAFVCGQGGTAHTAGDLLVIDTLEGAMTANPGDWVIRGVKGEFYPCKPDIFEATYDPVEVERGTPEAAKPLTPETACKPAGGGTDG